MKSALQFHSRQFKLTEEDISATTGDFQGIFARRMSDLFRLSQQLTADAKKAEDEFVSAEELNRPESTTAFPTNTYDANRSGIGEVKDSCPPFLD